MIMGTASIHILVGEDDYRAGEKAREILDSAVPSEQRDFGLETIDGRVSTSDEAAHAVWQVVESLRTLGFFGNAKLVWLRDADFFRDSATGRTEIVKTAVQGLTDTVKAGLPSGQTLMISSPKLDKRTAFYKACQAAHATIYDFSLSEKAHEAARQAGEQLRKVLARTNLKMSRAVEQGFLGKVGSDTRQIVNEVEKLSVYLGDRHEVEAEDLAAVVCASHEAPAWDLLDAVGERNLPLALRLCRQLLFQSGKESPIGLLHFLAGRLQEWIVYRQALDRGWIRGDKGGRYTWGQVPENARQVFSEDLKKDPMKVHPYRAGMLAQHAAQYSMAELTAAYRATVEACEQMVTGRTPPAMLLELLIIRVLSR